MCLGHFGHSAGSTSRASQVPDGLGVTCCSQPEEWHLNVSRSLLKEGGCTDINSGPFLMGFIWGEICISLSGKPATLKAHLGHAQREAPYREAGTPALISHLNQSTESVFRNAWLGEQWLWLNIYVGWYKNTSVKLLFLHPFSQKTKVSFIFDGRWSCLT